MCDMASLDVDKIRLISRGGLGESFSISKVFFTMNIDKKGTLADKGWLLGAAVLKVSPK